MTGCQHEESLAAARARQPSAPPGSAPSPFLSGKLHTERDPPHTRTHLSVIACTHVEVMAKILESVDYDVLAIHPRNGWTTTTQNSIDFPMRQEISLHHLSPGGLSAQSLLCGDAGAPACQDSSQPLPEPCEGADEAAGLFDPAAETFPFRAEADAFPGRTGFVGLPDGEPAENHE